MILPGISSVTAAQTVRGQAESNSTQEGDSSSAGWKYLTITEGDTIYTYIVIGKNMRVLIGKSSVKENDNDKDKKNADCKTDADSSSDKLNAKPQNDLNKLNAEKASFLTDFRMLGLTGYYQKKIRETMKDLEDNIGFDQLDKVNTNVEIKQNADRN